MNYSFLFHSSWWTSRLLPCPRYWTIPVYFFGPLFDWAIYFSGIECRSCLYIFEINSLSVASFAVIFSYYEGCLFTLLIVSFIVWKLLSLIRSHSLIFVFISITLGGGSWRILLWFLSESVLPMFSSRSFIVSINYSFYSSIVL